MTVCLAEYYFMTDEVKNCLMRCALGDVHAFDNADWEIVRDLFNECYWLKDSIKYGVTLTPPAQELLRNHPDLEVYRTLIAL